MEKETYRNAQTNHRFAGEKMTSFLLRMWNFGFGRIVKSYDFIIPLVLAVIGGFTFFSRLTPIEIRQQLLSDIILASISITTIVLAGFAIVISLTEKELVRALKKYDIYDNIIFTFEYTTVLSILTFIFSLITKYLFYSQISYYINLWLLIYLLACLIQLISFITAFGIKKGEIYS